MNVPFKTKMIASLFVPALAMSVAAHGADNKAPARSGAMNAPAAGMTADARPAAHGVRDMRASKLIGSDVRNAQGENLGDIKDLIVDVNNERVHYAVLSFGGFLGLGDKLIAFPVRSFTPVAGDDDKLVLNVDKDKLKQAPGFKEKEYPDFNAAKYRTQLDNFFGSEHAVKPGSNQRLVRASELIGKDIDDRGGKDVGEIEDLVVNMSNGSIRYAVVEFDKSWSLNDKLLVVPVNAFTFARERGKDLVWDIDKSRVENAATFDKNRWPDLNDPKFRTDLDRNLSSFRPVAGSASTAGAGGMGGNQATSATGRADNTNATLTDNRKGSMTTGNAGNTAAPRAGNTFDQLDANNDGNISRSEFDQGASRAGMKK